MNDIASDEARRLQRYDANDEEPTVDKHITHVTVNMPAPTPSQPDIKVETETEVSIGPFKAKRLPAWVVAVVAIGGVGVTALVAKLLG